MASDEYCNATVSEDADIDLSMECYEEELSPVQNKAYNDASNHFKSVYSLINSFLKNGNVLYDGESITAIKVRNSSQNKVATNNRTIEQNGLCYKTNQLGNESKYIASVNQTSNINLDMQKGCSSVIRTPIHDSTSQYCVTRQETQPSKVINKRNNLSIIHVIKAKPQLIFEGKYNMREEKNSLDNLMDHIMQLEIDEFVEWLKQQGVIYLEEYNSNDTLHKTEIVNQDNIVNMSDKFQGSLLESFPYSEKVFMKLIYHWSCQTDETHIIESLKVSRTFLNTIDTVLRGVCVAAVHEDSRVLLGGKNRMVELGIVCLRNIELKNIYVLGLLDCETKRIRLSIIDNETFNSSKYKCLRKYVNVKSIILTDLHANKKLLTCIGFQNIFQRPINDETNKVEYSNKNIINYLNKCLPRMFGKSISALSRSLIQQYLDELCWREMWGVTPLRAFSSILEHIKKQTRIKSEMLLPCRLANIARYPFLAWHYTNWEYNFTKCDSKASQEYRKTVIEAPLLINQNQTFNYKNIQSSSKCSNPSNKQPNKCQVPISGNITLKCDSQGQHTNIVKPNIENKLTEIQPKLKHYDNSPNSDHTPSSNKKRTISQVMSLHEYFYGQIPGKNSIDLERKCELDIKCILCNSIMRTNICMMKHFIQHVQQKRSRITVENEYCKYCLKSIVGVNSKASSFCNSAHLSEDFVSLKCMICEEDCHSRTKLIVHMHLTHNEMELPYECGVCGFRCSFHHKVVDHFYENHGFGESVQCPLCLKTVLLKKENVTITQNIYFFFNHLQKHTYSSLLNNCDRCVLSFVNEGLLYHHANNQHNSCKDLPNIERFPGFLMMPRPKSFVRNKVIRNTKLFNYFRNLNTFEYRKVNIKINLEGHRNALCCECENHIGEESHLKSEYFCLKCSFNTCCDEALWQHLITFHNNSNPHYKNSIVYRPLVLNKSFYCSCGYRTKFGNTLACHLIKCGKTSAYC